MLPSSSSSCCRLLVLAIVAALLASGTQALWLPQAISSNMVLQRAPQKAQLWGGAAPQSIVVLMLDSQMFKTFADESGQWQYELPVQAASTGRVINITADGDSVALSNVAFGDVFICSGQSNMEMAVSDAFNATAVVADSGNYPQLRLFGIQKKASLSPLNDTINRWTDGARWVVSGPDYVGGPSFDYFSATCYYFGRSLYTQLNTAGAVIPVGLIDTCWGGTRVEAWQTQEALDTCGPVQSNSDYYAELSRDAPAADRHSKRFRSIEDLNPDWAQVEEDPDPATPSVLYNGMIAPIINMRVAGATWYQGEANAGNATNYACRFPAMITDWRQQLNNFRLGFYFVLLAAWAEGGFPTWPLIRDAQLAALQLPYTCVSSAQDLGDEASPAGSIHPRNKSVVGERLALCALTDLYDPTVTSVGPKLYDVVWPIDGTPVQTVIMRFQSNLLRNAGLRLLDTSGCTLCCTASNHSGSAVTVLTDDGMYRPTVVNVASDAFIITATVDLSDAPGVNVVAVQHNWEQYPECAIYNSAAIPLLPVNLAKP